jgi:hypothetical protein
VNELFTLAAESLSSRLLVAAVTPILGGLIISGGIQMAAWKAQKRREEHDLRHAFVMEMTEVANALYMSTQLYWRVNTGRDAARKGELPELRGQLDDQYLKTRTAGLVLESRLEAYFTSDQVRQRWHRTIDFLTVRYFQVLYPDRGAERACRLARLYENNAKPSCTNVSEDELNKAQVVLQGFRQSLSEASILALTATLRDRKALDDAFREADRRAEERANEHPEAEVVGGRQ